MFSAPVSGKYTWYLDKMDQLWSCRCRCRLILPPPAPAWPELTSALVTGAASDTPHPLTPPWPWPDMSPHSPATNGWDGGAAGAGPWESVLAVLGCWLGLSLVWPLLEDQSKFSFQPDTSYCTNTWWDRNKNIAGKFLKINNQERKQVLRTEK